MRRNPPRGAAGTPLNHHITSVDEALEVVGRYFDEHQLPPKTRLALEELIPRG